MAAVRDRDREAWIALFAEDAVVEDPVGPSHFDPEGTGHHGPEGITKFWDMTVAITERLDFDIRDSFACGNEVANVGTITTTIGGDTPGEKSQMDAEGVFLYRVNDDGLIVSLRAFWELDRAMTTFRTIPTP